MNISSINTNSYRQNFGKVTFTDCAGRPMETLKNADDIKSIVYTAAFDTLMIETRGNTYKFGGAFVSTNTSTVLQLLDLGLKNPNLDVKIKH